MSSSEVFTGPENRSSFPALERLRQEAVRAHFAGDAATVNHCCALGLDFVARVIKAGPSQLDQMLWDLKWAYILSLFWLTDGYMRDLGQRSFQELRPFISRDSALSHSLETVLFLYEQSLLGPNATISKISELRPQWVQSQDSIEDSLLFQLCLEVAFVWDPWNNEWVKCGLSWCKVKFPPFFGQWLSKDWPS